MSKHPLSILLSALMALPLLTSCGGGNGASGDIAPGDTIAMNYATNLTMVDHGYFVKVDFRNPWDTTRVLESYILAPRDRAIPANLPKGIVVRTPLEKSVVYTSAHNNLINELGMLDAVAGVCDLKYINLPALHDKVRRGEIADCGASTAPNIEKILQLNPDAILLSAYEDANDHNKVAQIGIPVIDCIDYMESSPLARAEWMRFFGRLYGKGAQADSLFVETEKAYLAAKALAAKASSRPVVLTETIYGQSWDVPGANSTTGVLIEDAGGRNPFNKYRKSGSVQLAPEEVLYTAKDADIWLIKYWQTTPPTLQSMAKDNEIYTKFKAYANGNVYGCDTNSTTYFDDLAFHPHWILLELTRILHPELEGIDSTHRYYNRLQK